MMPLLSILVIYLTISVCFANNLPKFPNVGYVGSTYNLFKGNPESTKGLDPGFTLRNMFDYTYNNNKTTADGRYSVPDSVDVVVASSCSFSFSSLVIQETSSYFDSLSINVEASFKGWGASFSASADYKSVQESSSSSQTRYVKSQATCSAYKATVLPDGKLKFNPPFVRDVTYLPATSNDPTVYYDFLDHWGTHYTQKVLMGGRYGIQSSFSAHKLASMSSTDLNIKASAGYSGIVSINVDAATETQKKQAEEFESYREDYQIFQVGGKPPANENMSTFEWAQTVQNNPLPLTYSLDEISSVLTSGNFPYVKNIDAKRKSLQEAIPGYCEFLGTNDPFLCHSSSSRPDSGNYIKAHFAKARVKDWRLFDKDPSYNNFSCIVPTVTSTNQFIIGTFLSNFYFFYDVVAGPPLVVEDSALLADATTWTIDSSFNYSHTHFLRPTCPKGFSSVADFFCNLPSSKPSVQECLITIPRTKPCINETCLTQCRWRVEEYGSSLNVQNIFRIGFGTTALGNPSDNQQLFFIRRARPNHVDEYDLSLAMCLNFDCLVFAT